MIKKKNLSLFNQSPSRNCFILASPNTASDSHCIFFGVYTIFKHITQKQTLMGFLWFFLHSFYDICPLPHWALPRTRVTFFKQTKKICSWEDRTAGKSWLMLQEQGSRGRCPWGCLNLETLILCPCSASDVITQILKWPLSCPGLQH